MENYTIKIKEKGVKLYGTDYDYAITIKAEGDSEEYVINKAKFFIAEHGWWPGYKSTEDIINHLEVVSIEKE